MLVRTSPLLSGPHDSFDLANLALDLIDEHVPQK